MRNTILLVYDQQCPACQFYCRLVRIRESVGELQLIDARDQHPVMQEITAAGLDIDEGMVLKVGEQLYYGSDAINALALMSSDVGWFNRINFWLFRSAKLAGFIYPLLAAARKVLLKALRLTRINNLQIEDNEKF